MARKYTAWGKTFQKMTRDGKVELNAVTGEETYLFYGNMIIPFVDRFPKDTEIYSLITSKPADLKVTGT